MPRKTGLEGYVRNVRKCFNEAAARCRGKLGGGEGVNVSAHLLQ